MSRDVIRGRSPLKDRSFFRTMAPADERLRRQPVTFVKTFGSDRTVNFAKIWSASWITICLRESQDDKFHKTAEVKSRRGGSDVVRRILEKNLSSTLDRNYPKIFEITYCNLPDSRFESPTASHVQLCWVICINNILNCFCGGALNFWTWIIQ